MIDLIGLLLLAVALFAATEAWRAGARRRQEGERRVQALETRLAEQDETMRHLRSRIEQLEAGLRNDTDMAEPRPS